MHEQSSYPPDLVESGMLIYSSHFIEAQSGMRKVFRKMSVKLVKHWKYTQNAEHVKCNDKQRVTVCRVISILWLQRCWFDPDVNEILVDAHQATNKAMLKAINFSQKSLSAAENWIKHNAKTNTINLNKRHYKSVFETFSHDHNFWRVCFFLYICESLKFWTSVASLHFRVFLSSVCAKAFIRLLDFDICMGRLELKGIVFESPIFFRKSDW